jgi:tRNA 5-methylaminomethyl-2-thiouridine biosynthesis bifunctional protein
MGQRCGVAQMDSSGVELIHWTSEGAWIRPALFVQACLAEAVHRGARVVLNRAAHDLKSLASEFDHCVLAQADAIQSMVPWAELRLNAIRGTISSFSISEEHSLPHIICASGYATPVIEGEMVVGASFERLSNDAEDTPPDDEPGDSMSNLDRLEIISPKLASICRQQTPRDRTSIRSATLDRMPHVGQLLDPSTPLRPSVSRLEQMPRSERLWVLGGLGSRGLSSAPLGAELLAARITGRHDRESLVDSVSARVLAAVDPVRFALRRHQRRS